MVAAREEARATLIGAPSVPIARPPYRAEALKRDLVRFECFLLLADQAHPGVLAGPDIKEGKTNK